MNSSQRFLNVQKEDYFITLREMKERRKRTHWIWDVFLVLKGQGHSSMARQYWLDGQEDAKCFHAHPVLGKRFGEFTEAVLTHLIKPIRSITPSSTDSWEYNHCMTIFDALSECCFC